MWKLNPSLIFFFLLSMFACIHQHQMQADELQFKSIIGNISSKEDHLHEQLKEEASAWNLTRIDYELYQQMLHSSWVKLWWKDLDPPHVLGLMSTTLEDIQKFALIEAQLDFQRTERELRFQKAYSEAFKILHPTLKPIELIESEE